ncbi:hypothetical protein ACEQ8H_000588 [Pleosporales sp. CAS-2024a]
MAAPQQLPPAEVARLARDNLGPQTACIVIAFTGLAVVSVCLRLFARLKYKVAGWEDWTIVIATVLAICVGCTQVLQVGCGTGRHAMFVAFPEEVEQGLKYQFFSILVYNASLMFIKVSIIFQYKRIFTVQEMKWPLNAALAICVAWGIVTFFTSIFGCNPPSAYWRVSHRAGATCLADSTLWFVNAGMNIFTDLVVAILPVKAIWKLQMPNRQKFVLIGILTVGWFVCLVSILRLHALVHMSHHMDDLTYYGATAAAWSSIEMNLGIVCASLPALKPLLIKLIPGFSSRHSDRQYPSGYGDRLSEGFGLRSRATRNDGEEAGIHLPSDAKKRDAYSSTPDLDNAARSIYITSQIEHHYEKNSRHGSGSHVCLDSESQKDLVTNVTFPPEPFRKS